MEIEVSFILETVTFLKVNCHVVHLSVGFVGKVAEIDDRQSHLLFWLGCAPEFRFLFEAEQHFISCSTRLSIDLASGK